MLRCLLRCSHNLHWLAVVRRALQPEAARQLHDVFAWHIWQAYGWRYMGRATRHFVRGADAERFAQGIQQDGGAGHIHRPQALSSSSEAASGSSSSFKLQVLASSSELQIRASTFSCMGSRVMTVISLMVALCQHSVGLSSG